MNLEALQQAVVRKVSNYAVAIIIGDRLIGSGTLCSLDGHHGILTARHLFFEKDNLRPDLTSNKGVSLRLAYQAHGSHENEFEFHTLHLMDAHHRITERWGPDLVFAALPESPGLQLIKHRMSFFPLDQDPERQVEKATREEACAWCLVGYPDIVNHSAHNPESSGGKVDASVMVSFESVRKTHHHKGWDYLDIPYPTIASSFEPVDGDGFWKTPLLFDGNEPIAVGEPCLLGVVYLEKHGSGHHGYLRCHGPRSVYLKLEEDIRDHAV